MKNISVFCCALMTAAAMQAQIIYVHPDSTHSTIQSGIAAASPGDTVIVLDHIYYEQINFMGKKPLMVASRYLLDGDTSHIANTIIDGSQIASQDSGSIVYFISGEDTTSVLCGFTLRNGHTGTAASHPAGGKIYSGGAVFIFGSGAKITYNHITQNILQGSGQNTTGAGISGGQWWEDPHWVVIDHNTIDSNSCYSDYQQTFGTGICVTCNTRITNNLITDNLSHGTGTSIGAAAAFFAGGELAWEDLAAEVKNNVIRNNQAISDYSWGGGPGGFFQFNTGIFSGNIEENNVTLCNPSSSTSGAVGFYAPRTGTSVTKNIFRNNATSGYGGALYIEFDSQNVGSDTVIVESNNFTGNKAKTGGGLYSNGNPVLLQNNVFNKNHADNLGGAIYLMRWINKDSAHFAILINNSFSGNVANSYGGSIFSNMARPLIINSIFWNDTSTTQDSHEIYLFPGDTAEIAYSDFDPGKIKGTWIDDGSNIMENPFFGDPDLLTLSSNSACKNSGTASYTCHCGDSHNCPAYDILGFVRPWGPGYDMGAYEYNNIGIDNRTSEGSGLACSSHPNPFATTTTIQYSLVKPSRVRVTVYNSFGQLVGKPADGYQQKGEQKIFWNAENLPEGMYFYRIEAGGMVGTGKVIRQ